VAKSRFIQNNFVSGELSPLMRGRTDINQYYQGLQTANNVVLVPQGGVKRRPGTEHIALALFHYSGQAHKTLEFPLDQQKDMFV
jgi:hypothetical protein